MKDKVLLVEGKDDLHVVASLCQFNKLPKTFTIDPCDGVDRLFLKLPSLLKSPTPPSVLGVLLDADVNPVSRWKKIQTSLKSSYSLPSSPQAGGTILEAPNLPKLGIWLMPDNQLPGMLEDFCLQLIQQDNALDYTNKVVQEAKKAGHTTFKQPHFSKAQIHTYLAWQDEPGKPMGQAITAKVLHPNHPIAKEFVAWLQRLFG